MTVYEFLRTIASTLGDDRPGRPFIRYPLRDMIAFYNEARCFVASHRPDLFTDFVIMKLETGSYQDAKCCGCTTVSGVVAQIDVNGNTIKDLTSTGGSKNDTSKWFRAPCRAGATPGGTIIVSYTIEVNMGGVFTVDPPVKPGEDVWVKVKCVKGAGELCESALLGGEVDGETIPAASVGDCKFLPAIRSYILYRLLMGDRHATGAAQEAQAELKAAYTYLGLQYKMDQAQIEGSA
jgi:hypothetical protein